MDELDLAHVAASSVSLTSNLSTFVLRCPSPYPRVLVGIECKLETKIFDATFDTDCFGCCDLA